MASNLSSYGSEKPDHHSREGSSKPSSIMTREHKNEKFALGKRGILVFFTLSVLTLMAALDGTSLSVALPVGTLSLSNEVLADNSQDYSSSLEWNGN